MKARVKKSMIAKRLFRPECSRKPGERRVDGKPAEGPGTRTQTPKILATREGGGHDSVGSSDNKREERTDLPTGIAWETGDLHTMRRATGSGRRTLVSTVASTAAAATALTAFALTAAARKLDCETFSHEIGAVLRRAVSHSWS
jgi:hypothetical protein